MPPRKRHQLIRRRREVNFWRGQGAVFAVVIAAVEIGRPCVAAGMGTSRAACRRSPRPRTVIATGYKVAVVGFKVHCIISGHRFGHANPHIIDIEAGLCDEHFTRQSKTHTEIADRIAGIENHALFLPARRAFFNDATAING